MPTEQIEELLTSHAVTLDGLRDLCLLVDRDRKEEDNLAGFKVFCVVADAVLSKSMQDTKISNVMDAQAWKDEADKMPDEYPMTHSTVNVQVTKVLEDWPFKLRRRVELGALEEEEIAAADAATAAILATAPVAVTKLEMLKEGADPSLAESWIPVAKLSDLSTEE